MLRMTLRRLAPATALLVCLAGAGTAQAINVVGRWDPQFGAPFLAPDGVLGWEGTAQWVLPDACLPQAVSLSGTFVANGSECSNGGMFLQSATVNFYDFGADPTGDASFLTSLSFGPNSANVAGMTLSGSSVLGVHTGLSSTLTPSGPGSSFDGINGYSFALQFTGGTVQLYFATNGQPFAAFSSSSSYGEDECEDDEENEKKTTKKKYCPPPPPKPCVIGDVTAPNCGVNDPRFPANVRFSTVPEPQTYMLLLAGMGALGFIARRRRKG